MIKFSETLTKVSPLNYVIISTRQLSWRGKGYLLNNFNGGDASENG
jgi:hypothetical protein